MLRTRVSQEARRVGGGGEYRGPQRGCGWMYQVCRVRRKFVYYVMCLRVGGGG